jgi:hypothetical protein
VRLSAALRRTCPCSGPSRSRSCRCR